MECRIRMPRRLRGAAGTSILLFLLALPALARAGGGRNLPGGSLILYVLLLPVAVLYGLYVTLRMSRKEKQAEALLEQISRRDGAWEPSHLESHVRTTFFEIQRAWTAQDLPALQKLLDPTLFAEWKAQIEMLQSQGGRNVMEDLALDQARIIEVKNFRDDDQDSFTACIDAQATDYTVDRSGAVAGTNTRSRNKAANLAKSHERFQEFWTYQRHGQDWLLRRIDQSGEWARFVKAPLVDEHRVP